MSTKSPKIETSNPAVEADMSRAATDLAVWQAQASANARAVAQQLGYDGPLGPDILQQGIVEGKARIEFELFAIGARLVLLREQCAHGEFLQRLETLEIDPRAAQRYMQVALKFPNATTSAHLAKLGRSKLFELAMLDDSVLSVLESEGTVLGYKPDELEQMSVREMRAKLKEALEEHAAVSAQIKRKDEKINALNRQLNKKVVAMTDWPDAFSVLAEQADAAMRTIKKAYDEIDAVIEAAMQVVAEPGEEGGLQKAHTALAEAIKRGFDETEAKLVKCSALFDKTLAIVGEVAPE